MRVFEVIFARSARKELEKINIDDARKILNKIESMGKNPRPHGCEKLKGGENLWRIRIGNYRVIYKIKEINNIIDITIIRHRKDAYK